MPDKNEQPPFSGPKDTGWRRFGGKAALVAGGLVAGGVLATTLSANAGTSPASTTAPSESGSGYDGSHSGGRAALSDTGTVTAVGGSSVTIRKTDGTTTVYNVTSSSDVDKNGEAKLSDLKPGDAVRFSTANGNTIDILHAGDENLNRPQGGHGHGDGDGDGPGGASGSGTAPGSGYGG